MALSCRALTVASVSTLLVQGIAVPRIAGAQCPDGTPPPCAAARGRVPAATSVAVLYFDNVSADSSDAYIAVGLTEELIARLGEIERLQVKSRTAVQRYRGRAADDPAAVGRALGVANLVSGSVRRGGDRLRVTVELTRAASGLHVWGDTYERDAADLMAVESDIAQAIASGIAGRLAPAERRTLAARPTANPEAYDHYLRGNFLLALREPGSVRRAIGEYEAALRADPAFSRASARIAMAYGLFYDWGWTFPDVPRDSLIGRGSAAAATALRLDSSVSEAWMATGMLRALSAQPDPAEVDAALERATTLDPRNAEAWHLRGYLLSIQGRDSAAAAAFSRALALEPERVVTLYDWAWELNVLHRFAEARRLIDSAVALDPQSYFALTTRAQFALNRGDTASARRDALAAARSVPPGYESSTEPLLAALEAASGDTVAARSRMQRLLGPFAAAGYPYTQGYNIAVGLLEIGDRAGALSVLESVRPRSVNLGYYLRDPALDPLRGEPRFQRLVEETRQRR